MDDSVYIKVDLSDHSSDRAWPIRLLFNQDHLLLSAFISLGLFRLFLISLETPYLFLLAWFKHFLATLKWWTAALSLFAVLWETLAQCSADLKTSFLATKEIILKMCASCTFFHFSGSSLSHLIFFYFHSSSFSIKESVCVCTVTLRNSRVWRHHWSLDCLQFVS